MKNPPTISLILVGTQSALIQFGTSHDGAALGKCTSCRCLSISLQEKKAAGRHNVMSLSVGKWNRFKRESVQEHCCIPFHNKELSSLLQLAYIWHLLDLIWLNRLCLLLPLFLLPLCGLARSMQGSWLRAHVKQYHSEEKSIASAPICSTVIQHSAW